MIDEYEQRLWESHPNLDDILFIAVQDKIVGIIKIF